MYRIIVNLSCGGTFLIKHHSEYSILKKSRIELYRGKNIIDDLKYGFYFDYFIFNGIRNTMSIDFSNYDSSNVKDMNCMFLHCNFNELDLSNLNTHNVTDMRNMFYRCHNIKHLDLRNFDINKLLKIDNMFYYCCSLEFLDISGFNDISHIISYDNLFCNCHSLKHIRCTKSFKEWCLENQNNICLPISMREGGNGVWEIID